VSKRRDRPYQAGRSRYWVKVKNGKHSAIESRDVKHMVLVHRAFLLIRDYSNHREASARNNRGASASKVRVLYFRDKPNKAWHGFARKYREFLLPSVGGPLSAPTIRPPVASGGGGSEVVDRARRMVAEAFGVPPSAVRISVDFVGSQQH
jgi:hypothetical protein